LEKLKNFSSKNRFSRRLSLYQRLVVEVVLPDPFREMGRGGTPRRPNSRATPQGLNQRSKMEKVVPKMEHQRGSDAGQSRRKWVRSCRGCPQVQFRLYS